VCFVCFVVEISPRLENLFDIIHQDAGLLVHFSFTSRKNNSRRGRDKLFDDLVIRLVGALPSVS